MDETFLEVDCLAEMLAWCLRRQPLAILQFLWTLVRYGKPRAKHELAARCPLDWSSLPVNSQVLAICHAWARSGRPVILASASPESVVAAVAATHGCFDGHFGSDAGVNRKGTAKLDRIVSMTDGRAFAYIGDSAADLPLLRQATEGYLVDRRSALVRSLPRLGIQVSLIHSRAGGAAAVLRSMRLHQWVKNVLLFVPLVAAHRFADWAAIGAVCLMFLAMGMVASATYIANDLFDLDSDRKHPRKRNRPLASGALSIKTGVLVAAGLMLAGIVLAAALSVEAVLLLAAYTVATLTYSLRLKAYVIIDALTLAGLYTFRVMAGAIVASITLSFWLAAFSMALFLSLAMVKRCAELESLRSRLEGATHGRDYRVSDLMILTGMGLAAGYAAVLLLALYVDQHAAKHYTYPALLWLICPLLLYWINRLWVKTGRGEMHDDPIVYTFRDRGSLLTVVATMAVFLLALLVRP